MFHAPGRLLAPQNKQQLLLRMKIMRIAINQYCKPALLLVQDIYTLLFGHKSSSQQYLEQKKSQANKTVKTEELWYSQEFKTLCSGKSHWEEEENKLRKCPKYVCVRFREVFVIPPSRCVALYRRHKTSPYSKRLTISFSLYSKANRNKEAEWRHG